MNITRYFTCVAVCVGLLTGCGGGGSGGSGGGGGGSGGTTAVAPAIVTQPASLSVTAGASAVFTVTATGDAPLSYQWKRDGVAIAGAATAAYTLAAATSGDDGATFTVEVSNPAGALSSAAATLSVTPAAKAWGPVVMLSTGDVRATAIGPQVAIDAAGNAIGVWQESQVSTAVWARRHVVGAGWSAATAVDGGAVGASALPQLAMTPGGVAVASFLHGTSSGSTRMIASRFDGTSWSGGLGVDLLDGVIDADHCLAIAPDGAAALAFNQSDNVAGRRATAAMSTAAGAWAAPEVIGDAGSYAPQVAIAANGDAVLVWLVGDTGTTSSLWASRRRGPFWSAPVRIIASVKGMATPRLRIDAAGNAIAVWVQRPTPRNEVHAVRFTASTGSWGSPAMLNDVAAQAYEPELAMTASGDTIVVWTEANDAGQASGIGARRYLAATAVWSDATRVQSAGVSGGNLPRVALDATGNAMAVWLQAAMGDATRLEVWAAAFDAQGARWASPTKLMTDPTAHIDGGESQAPQIAVNADGDAVVAWVQRTDEAPQPSVWARVFR